MSSCITSSTSSRPRNSSLRSLAKATPEWEGHERAEAHIRGSGVRVDHVAGDRTYYSLKDDRVVLPDRGQFGSQSAYTHTALHELGHASGHTRYTDRPSPTIRRTWRSIASLGAPSFTFDVEQVGSRATLGG